MTETELRKAEARYRRAFALSEQARAYRNELIRDALADSWTHAAIAKATGLTRSRIGQMAVEKRHQPSLKCGASGDR
jgi:hypothetical protein